MFEKSTDQKVLPKNGTQSKMNEKTCTLPERGALHRDHEVICTSKNYSLFILL